MKCNIIFIIIFNVNVNSAPSGNVTVRFERKTVVRPNLPLAWLYCAIPMEITFFPRVLSALRAQSNAVRRHKNHL